MSADQLLALEGPLRLAAFVLIGLLLWSLQRRFALRAEGRADRRLLRNLGLVLIDSLLLRLAFPLLAVALAVDVEARGGGLFGWLAWPPWVEFVAALLLLDMAIYWQHRLFHRIPLFWRLHRVHHSDVAFDVSTGVRFHPLEIAASMLVKLGLVVLLGPPALAVLLFELLLSLGSLFTHSDFAFPKRLDGRLRVLLVTPSMHRIHHSTWRRETDSNYGFHLSVWDRLFRSYRVAPREPEATMPIGLEQFREPAEQTLWQLLLQPLKSTGSPGAGFRSSTE
jgi:sterol desaturase/sphingolipid hydroxylase (fatty acid hydroxylase superfamily)